MADSNQQSDSAVQALQEFFVQLSKAMKNMRMYLHQPERYTNFVKPTFEILVEQLGVAGGLTVKVEQAGFSHKGVAVYDEPVTDQNLAFQFYQEGVRLLRFRQGLTLVEFLDFVLIWVSATQSRLLNEEILSQMWKKDLKHIECVVMESYALGGEGGSQTEDDLALEVDQIIGHIYQSLTGKGTDQIQFARVSVEDVEIELQQIQQARGIRLAPFSISSQLVGRFQDEIMAEEELRQLPKLLRVLLSAFSLSLEPELEQQLGDTLILLLDFFLLKEDFDDIHLMMSTLERWQQQTPAGSRGHGWRGIFRRICEKMYDGERIHRVAEIVETTTNPENIRKANNYLKYLDQSSFVPLLQSLETLNRPEARRLFCDLLSKFGAERLDLLQSKLLSPKANLVRDILSIFDQIGPPNRIELVAPLLNHPNLAIRVDVLKIIGNTGEQQAIPLLRQALDDKDAQVRLNAAQLLATAAPKLAQQILLQRAQQPDFADLTPQEQVGFYAALAMTNTLEALHYLRTQLQATSLLSKKKLEEQQRVIVAGLASSGSISAYNLLQAELKRGIKSPTLAAAAERACELLHKKLLAGQEG